MGSQSVIMSHSQIYLFIGFPWILYLSYRVWPEDKCILGLQALLLSCQLCSCGKCKITKYQSASWVGQHDPGRHPGSCLSPGVSDEPHVGQDHREPDQGVETEDDRHALPVGQQGPALSQLLVLGLFVVNHADDHQEETGRHLNRSDGVRCPVSGI